MDGGKSSWAKSKASVVSAVVGAAEFIKNQNARRICRPVQDPDGDEPGRGRRRDDALQPKFAMKFKKQ